MHISGEHQGVFGLVVAIALSTATAAGCQTEHLCATYAAFGLTVTVTDTATGAPVCDAVVSARDGTYLETLTPLSGACTYFGAIERPGTYTVTAVAGARTASAAPVAVTADECHVKGQQVTVVLPAP